MSPLGERSPIDCWNDSGSAAALIQATIGNVAVGSWFAILQGAGAGGAGLVALNEVVQGGGAALAVGAGVLAWARGHF